MFYPREKWDPVLILAQIVALQSLYYILLAIFFFFTDWLSGQYPTLDQFFDSSEVTFTSFFGLITISSYIGAALVTLEFFSIYFGILWIVSFNFFIFISKRAYGCTFIVERAKKVLDFTATLHFVHLIITALVTSLPTCWEWWLTIGISLLLMTLLGEYLCMQRELREIKTNNFSTIQQI